MMRSQTDEQLAACWDLEPWVGNGMRSSEQTVHGLTFAPRVECIPNGYANQPYHKAVDERGREVWRHRPPVNPILVRFRAEEDADHNGAMVYLDLFDNVRTDMLRYRWKAEGWDSDFGQEAVDHARKVLTRLAALA